MFMVKAFMSLKFHDGEEDKQKVNDITVALENAGIINYVMVRDCEKYGKSPIPEGLNLMPDFAFPKMAESDMLIVEFTEKGVGLGMGAGFTSALDKPIYVIAKTGSDISSTMKSVANVIIIADKDNIVKQTAKYDIARMSMDKISEDELISFLEKGTTLKCCGGFNISDAPFVHLKEGSMSTAMGMTTEFVKDFISKI